MDPDCADYTSPRACVKGLIYYDKNEMRRKDAEECGESDEQDTTGRANAHTPRAPPVPPSPPSSRSHEQVPVPKPKKQAPMQNQKAKNHEGSRKSSKVDRNALSARSTGNLLSEAALAAQARVDAAKEEPKKKRPRLAHERAEPSPAPPAREPSTTRAQGSSHSFDDVTDAETRDLVAMATRNSFLTPVTSEEAVTFLRAIMGLELFVEDGEIVGRNLLNGAIYSTDGASGEPLPPGARAAFMLAYGDKLKDEYTQLEWQTVPPPKGQRHSRDQRAS